MTYSAVNFPCSVQFSSWYITWTWLMCGDRWHNTIILRKRKGATDTDTLVSRVQRVCRSVQIRSSGASECAGVVFESVGIWSRECERSSRISSGRLLCMDYLFQLLILGDCSLEPEGKSQISWSSWCCFISVVFPETPCYSGKPCRYVAVIVLTLYFVHKKWIRC